MLMALNALQAELDTPLLREQVTTLLPMLGFPIDGVEEKSGTAVLDVDITANRGDLLGHRGVARELAAKLSGTLRPLSHTPVQEGAPAREIRLEVSECPLYATALLSLGQAGGTPNGATGFLASLGATVKQMPAVDASNEILHRYGHPTHAFDADTLRGPISVRRAKASESLVTLDGVARKLTVEDLVIADERGPIALAGVMGGEATKVTADTRRVLLESAYFDPRTVRLMARRHALHTDGSARFGRGADPAMAKVARDLFVARLEQWAGATLEAAWTVGVEPKPAESVMVQEALVARMAGEPVSVQEIAAILKRLGCEVRVDQARVNAVPPSWRHDLAIPEDLAEEVLRLRGYDTLPEALPPVQSEPEPLALDYLKRQRLARRLANLGFHQTVTYGFVSPQMDATFSTTPPEGRALGNPLGVDYSILRGSLLPSLEAVARHNERNGAREVRLFEMAPTYASSASGPVASHCLALVWSGERGGEDPLTPSRPVHPLDVVAIAQDLGVGGSVQELGVGLYGMEVNLEQLPSEAARVIPAYRPFSRFPAVERDLSLLVPAGQIYGPLAETMRTALPAECADLRCVEIYRGKGLEAGHEAWLIRLSFQADRTLVSEEVDGWVKLALAAAEALGAKLRA